ncbi:hypothetical protein CBR_g24423 [Chara braunii]|uniref:Branched-chain-amino-acid aminotransferase n=1 Tax=Chara braunii TaxID=69332 RepID=A0A388JMM1_CHABU|nr:hypothetical protein CBR_g24423 [Chara braunii]|eukprot:GBG59080.1 hypothetical protein CBR_g24423 [Chara braunii]
MPCTEVASCAVVRASSTWQVMAVAMAACSSSSSSACRALSHAHDLGGRTDRTAGGSVGERAGGGSAGAREWRAASSRSGDGLRPASSSSSSSSSSSMLVMRARWRNASRIDGAARRCIDNVPRGSFLAGYGAVKLDRNSALSQETCRHAEWNLFVSRAAASTTTPSSSHLAPQMEEESDLLDWDSIGFSLRSTDFMYVRIAGRDGVWGPGELRRYGNIEMSPGAGVINYGQGVFEGLKANRTEDGRVLLFRPTENGLRMEMSGSRMCMPTIPPDEFVDAVLQTVAANRRWVRMPTTPTPPACITSFSY